MQALFNIINVPLGWVLENLANIFGGSFAAAVFVFTLLINVVLIPLNIKSQKSSVQQTRIKPKLDEIKKECGDDRQKYSQETQKLYQEEGVSMGGGCLPLILRMVLMLSIYWLILSPLTYMTGVDKTKLENVTNTISTSMTDMKKNDKDKYENFKKELSWRDGGSYNELNVVNIIRNNKEELLEKYIGEKKFKKIEKDLAYVAKKDAEVNIDYSFITSKINLTETPKFSMNIFRDAKWIWTMPVLAFLSQMLSSVLSMKMQKKINPDAPSMAGMMLMMPLMTLFIGFGMPGGVAFYWACSSLIGGFIQLGVQYFYGPHKMLARERAKELSARCKFEEGQIKKISAKTQSEAE